MSPSIELLRNVLLALLLTTGGGLLAQNTITNGLVVYLNFDNNIDAQAGTTNNGTAVSGSLVPAFAPGTPEYTNGIIGSAAVFNNDPANGSVVTDWACSLGDIEWLYSNSWSFSIWVNSTDTSGVSVMGNKNWSSRRNIGWILSEYYGEWLTVTPDGLPYETVGNRSYADGLWHNCAATFDRGSNLITAYLDGAPAGSVALGTNGLESLTPSDIMNTLVGGSGDGAYSLGLGGALDDLGMWSRVLSAAEATAIYNAGVKHQPLTQANTNAPPSIVTPPSSETQAAGLFSGFSVTAIGGQPLSYQWCRNGIPLVGANNPTLVYPVALSDSGASYTVVVTNSAGSVTSTPPAMLTVTSPPASITNGLVVYLDFDNNINAQAGTTNNGTAVYGGQGGFPTCAAEYTPTNGFNTAAIGTAAAVFNNDLGSTQISDWACFLGDIEWIYSNSWSFSIWVNATNTTGGNAAIGNKDWTKYAYVGWLVENDTANWLTWTPDGVLYKTIGNFNWNDGNWHHLAATFDRNVNLVVAYVDGNETGASALGITGLESLTPDPSTLQYNGNVNCTLVGATGGLDGQYAGALDDVGMWQRPISEAEVKAIYQSGTNGMAVPQAAYPQPSLSATLAAGGGSVSLIYPAWAVTYTIESSPSLAAAPWSPVAAVTNLYMNGNTVVNVPASPGSRFFRLRH
jgi:hypothetical protein